MQRGESTDGCLSADRRLTLAEKGEKNEEKCCKGPSKCVASNRHTLKPHALEEMVEESLTLMQYILSILSGLH